MVYLIHMRKVIAHFQYYLCIRNRTNVLIMNYIESALEEGIKIIGRYANLQLGVSLFPNGDNTFDVFAYHYTQGEWLPLGDAEDVNNFATEKEAFEQGIKVIKEKVKYWDWALSDECTDEDCKNAVHRLLEISPSSIPILQLFSGI